MKKYADIIARLELQPSYKREKLKLSQAVKTKILLVWKPLLYLTSA